MGTHVRVYTYLYASMMDKILYSSSRRTKLSLAPGCPPAPEKPSTLVLLAPAQIFTKLKIIKLYPKNSKRRWHRVELLQF